MIEVRKPVLALQGLGQWLDDRAGMLAAAKVAKRPQALALLRRELVRTLAESFLQARSPAGVPWARLKARHGPPLLLTRNLYETAVQGVKQSRIQTPGRRFDVWISMAPYGVFHQFGTQRIPRRQFFGFKPESLKRFGGGLVDLLVKDLTKGPGGTP